MVGSGITTRSQHPIVRTHPRTHYRPIKVTENTGIIISSQKGTPIFNSIKQNNIHATPQLKPTYLKIPSEKGTPIFNSIKQDNTHAIPQLNKKKMDEYDQEVERLHRKQERDEKIIINRDRSVCLYHLHNQQREAEQRKPEQKVILKIARNLKYCLELDRSNERRVTDVKQLVRQRGIRGIFWDEYHDVSIDQNGENRTVPLNPALPVKYAVMKKIPRIRVKELIDPSREVPSLPTKVGRTGKLEEPKKAVNKKLKKEEVSKRRQRVHNAFGKPLPIIKRLDLDYSDPLWVILNEAGIF